MKLFKICNIGIKISYSLLAILVFSMFFNYLSQLLILILVILIHEFTHCLACLYYGIKVDEIVIFIFGGVAKFQGNIEEKPRQEIIIALAGPLSNLLLIIITFFILYLFKIENNKLLDLFIGANLTIGGFNIIPILPLDGGRIVRGLIANYIGIKRASYMVIKLGYLISILLIFLFTYIFLAYKRIEYIFLVFLFIYIILANKKERERLDLMLAQNIILKKKSLLNREIIDVKHIIVMETTCIKSIFNEFTLEEYCIITVINRVGKILGTLAEGEIIDAIIEYENNMTAREMLEANK